MSKKKNQEQNPQVAPQDQQLTEVDPSRGLTPEQAQVMAALPAVITPPKPERLKKSTVANPTKLVWHIADALHEKHPGIKRHEVIKACIDAGIATHTARTQYQAWFRAVNAAPAVIPTEKKTETAQ